MLDSNTSKTPLQWQYGIIAGVVLLFIALYPQLKLWQVRGIEWQGAYAINDIDEVAYAAYLRALMDGRPRKNDPYTGRDDAPDSPQHESLFSIQFAAPYAVAIPARVLGVSVNTAMTVSGAIAAFLAGLALFWLIGRITGDSIFAMAGALVVVCGGTLAAGEGAIGEVLRGGLSYPYHPGLRRYVPSIPFPVFFALGACVWQMLSTDVLSKRIIYSVLASASFAFLVFSYFFIWTAAAAWLACLVLVWLVARPEGWRRDFKAFAALGAACLVSLAPYAIMLSDRAKSMDEVQALALTREPDIFRLPTVIGFAVLSMLVVAVLIKAVSPRDRAVLFAGSLALMPLAVFNQQLITGHSLQPIHYQVFIGNYVVALAVVLTLGILWKSLKQSAAPVASVAFLGLALIAAVWGFVECHYTVRVLDEANLARDEAMPVARRLAELHREGAVGGSVLLYSDSSVVSDDLPTQTPYSVLWARHQHVFTGLSWEENKQRYYQYLYFLNLDENWLESSLKEDDFISIITLFGWGRHTPRLSADYKPLTNAEIEAEARTFGDYARNFDAGKAAETELRYVVAPAGWEIDFTNLDRWFVRDEGETVGGYVLYKVRLRETSQAR